MTAMRIPLPTRMSRIMDLTLFSVLASTLCFAQSAADLQSLATPQQLELSADGSRLWYKLGSDWWRIETAGNARPERDNHHQSAEPGAQTSSHTRVGARTSPERKMDRVSGRRTSVWRATVVLRARPSDWEF